MNQLEGLVNLTRTILVAETPVTCTPALAAAWIVAEDWTKVEIFPFPTPTNCAYNKNHPGDYSGVLYQINHDAQGRAVQVFDLGEAHFAATNTCHYHFQQWLDDHRSMYLPQQGQLRFI